MKQTALIYLLFVLIGCQTATEKEQLNIKAKIPSDQDVTTTLEIGHPVDVLEIKNLNWVTTTSGIATDTENLKSCDWKEEGFFGFYFLIDQEKGPVGKLTVHAKDENGWRFDNQTDEFARIELQSNKIRIWDKISVGSTKSELLDFLEPNDVSTSDSLIRSQLDSYSTEFLILGDTVNRLMIERNCK